MTPFGPELPLASSYNFVCPKGHETRPKVRAFRDWLFAEMAETKEKWGRWRMPDDHEPERPTGLPLVPKRICSTCTRDGGGLAPVTVDRPITIG